jgi:glutamine synthetase
MTFLSKLAPKMFSRTLHAPASMSIRAFSALPQKLAEIGKHQFNHSKMQTLLPGDVYARFRDATKTGSDLSKGDKNAIADAMFQWATSLGCTQYSHTFYPVRNAGIGVLGSSAGMKHDSFVSLDFGNPGENLKPLTVGFSGGQLFLGETDGSSYPNGGLRGTHFAGAWTAWDMTSPPYVKDDTLFIPTVLITQAGDAIDEKTPHLRSMDAINREGVRLLKNLGVTNATQVVSNNGPEQEFFLIDRDLYLKRPDLMACGRTVVGASPAKGQEECLNYFGTMCPKVKACLVEFHGEMWKLGCSNVVMHNEVAPGQHEWSPIFSLTNVGADQNALAMDVLNQCAMKQGLTLLLHEKPFAGINGSGKHCNWGLNTDTGKNLYVPGKTAQDQQVFVTFVTALAHACKNYGDTLRASIGHAGNDHRLGAQEAPPAIVSIGTGAGMEAHLKKVIEGGPLEGYGDDSTPLSAGCSAVAPFNARLEDRNRTAPVPFCGNRFEFRAVGSSQSVSFPLTVLNTAVAEGMSKISDLIEGGKSPRDAVALILKDAFPAIFNGDGYSEEWQVEAARRGLPNLKIGIQAVDKLTDAKNVELFSKHKVLSKAEVEARKATLLEAYANILTIEASVMVEMMETAVIPACAQDLQRYAGTNLAGDRPELYSTLATQTAALKKLLDQAGGDGHGFDDEKAAAFFCLETLKPQMAVVREAHDAAEGKIAQDLYPFPKYAEMLYSHHSAAE